MMKKTFTIGFSLLCIYTFAQVGINTQNPQGLFNVDGKSTTATTNPTTGVPTTTQLADDFIVTKSGATGIGTLPNGYAMLDIASTNKGILAPRVDLTSNVMDLNSDGDNQISNQPSGLLIYNSGSVLPKGYYFWNGTEWMVFDSSTAIAPVIGALVCASSTLSPAAYTTGVPYTGNLRVPYTGGNGGSYQPGSPITLNGLTFTLRAGKLEYGEGELVFSVTGTPTSSVDFPITFTQAQIPFLNSGQSCTAIITSQTSADIKNIAFLGNLVLTNDNGRIGYHLVGTTPDGKWSVRCFVPQTRSFDDVNLQLRYNGSLSDPLTIDIIQNTTYMWGGGATNSGNQVRYPKNIWAGSNSDVSTLNIANIQDATNFPNWGDPGVYASSKPEYRLYHWTDFAPNGTKVFYTMEFMMGSSTPNGSTGIANATNCPLGVCNTTKVFFNLRQITAP